MTKKDFKEFVESCRLILRKNPLATHLGKCKYFEFLSIASMNFISNVHGYDAEKLSRAVAFALLTATRYDFKCCVDGEHFEDEKFKSHVESDALILENSLYDFFYLGQRMDFNKIIAYLELVVIEENRELGNWGQKTTASLLKEALVEIVEDYKR